MDKKSFIRIKYFNLRKKKYFNIEKYFFTPLIKLLKSKKKNKKINISLYYPSSYEVDVLKIIDLKDFKKHNYLLPVIEKNNKMNFHEWKKKDILALNKFGVPEPVKSKKIVPDIILLPLLVFDKKKNRIGYGKGYYDKFLNKFNKKKKIVTIGVAFSFQKYHKLPINSKDYKLDYIITEKGIIK